MKHSALAQPQQLAILRKAVYPSLTHVANLLTVNEETSVQTEFVSSPVHLLLSVPVARPVFLGDADKSVQTSCRVHRGTYAKGGPVCQAVPETMTATAKRLV